MTPSITWGVVRMRATIRLLVAALLMSVSILGTSAARATNIGMQGCTPGYWKTNPDNWQETNAGFTFGTLYVDARANVSGLTLLDALQGGGGPGADGAATILARAATAAWLNAAQRVSATRGAGTPAASTAVRIWSPR